MRFPTNPITINRFNRNFGKCNADGTTFPTNPIAINRFNSGWLISPHGLNCGTFPTNPIAINRFNDYPSDRLPDRHQVSNKSDRNQSVQGGSFSCRRTCSRRFPTNPIAINRFKFVYCDPPYYNTLFPTNPIVSNRFKEPWTHAAYSYSLFPTNPIVSNRFKHCRVQAHDATPIVSN